MAISGLLPSFGERGDFFVGGSSGPAADRPGGAVSDAMNRMDQRRRMHY